MRLTTRRIDFEDVVCIFSEDGAVGNDLLHHSDFFLVRACVRTDESFGEFVGVRRILGRAQNREYRRQRSLRNAFGGLNGSSSVPSAGSLYGTLMNISVSIIGVLNDYFIYENAILNGYGISESTPRGLTYSRNA